MRAIVDKEDCIGCGLCPTVCPEVFEMQDDGKAGIIKDGIEKEYIETSQEAAETCPVNAINILQ